MYTEYVKHPCETNLAKEYNMNPNEHLVMKVKFCYGCGTDMEVGDEIGIPQVIAGVDHIIEEDTILKLCPSCQGDFTFDRTFILDVVEASPFQLQMPSGLIFNYYKIVSVIEEVDC